jgi:hypothetical protein
LGEDGVARQVEAHGFNMKIKYDFGQEGSIEAPESHPLMRAVGAILRQGGSDYSIRSCFFSENGIGSGPPRWLGVFVKTAGSRILFFPGFFLEPHDTEVVKGGEWKKYPNFQANHMTLEKDLRSWHITSALSEHPTRFKTVSLGGGRVLWLSMSLSSSDLLPVVYQSTDISCLLPASHSLQRCSMLKDALTRMPEVWVSLSEERVRYEPGFLHFWIIYGKEIEGDLSADLTYPDFASHSSSEAVRQLHVKAFNVAIDEQISLQVITAWHPGKLNFRVVFSGQNTR